MPKVQTLDRQRSFAFYGPIFVEQSILRDSIACH